MTDEQLKAISRFLLVTGSAVYGLGAELAATITKPDPPPVPDPNPPTPDPPVPDPPPPPVEEETAFEKAVVLEEDFKDSDGKPLRISLPNAFEFPRLPTHNVTGKSWGLSFKVFHHSPPTGTSPLSLWDDSSPQWQVKCPGPTRLAVAFALTGGGYSGFDAVVDDLTGRWAHVVVGCNHLSGLTLLWIDGVLRDSKFILQGIGHSEGGTPPLIVNSTAAGHAAGDISIDELVYAVGAAPTQSDVDRLYAITPRPDGFSNGVEGSVVWAEVNGPQSALPLVDPLSFIDGRHVPMKRVLNNPPRTVRYEGPVPEDVGREL